LPVGAAMAAMLLVASAAPAAVPTAANAAPTGEAAGDDIGLRLAAPAHVVALVDAGDFKGAEAAIAAALENASLNADQRTALEFQRERMRRILLDFRLDEAGAKERLRRDIPDLT